MKVINKKLVSVLCILVVIISIGIFFICSKDTDNVTLDEVKLKEPEKNSGMFAIMLQKDAGSAEYEQSPNETFPKEGYTLNEEKSGCLDSDGQKIEDATLSYADGKVKVETGNTSYCYIYFDIKEIKDDLYKLCKTYSNIGECIQSEGNNIGDISGLKATPGKGDLAYRYVGVCDAANNQCDGIVDNFVCFGDTTCNGETDNHMYRIIGITSDGKLKIIKNKATNTSAKWNTSYSSDVKWDTASSAELFTSLNGNDFLNSETYIPQSSSPIDWKNKISSQTWKIRDIKGAGSGYTDNGDKVWTWESARESTGEYKIGLMYLSDYYYSLDGTGNLNCYTSSYRDQCKESWLHISHNGNSETSNLPEWTMVRYGTLGGSYYAWYVDSDGSVYRNNLGNTFAVRPVFYLNSSVTITGGEGTLKSPYIIN